MTRQQISKALGICLNYVNIIFETAIKEHPELNTYGKPVANQQIDYPLNAVFLALSYIRNGAGLTEIEKIIIEESFTMKPVKKPKAIGIDGTEEFLEKLKKRPNKKCCSTCAYCIKSTIRNQKPVYVPFCKLWDRYIFPMKAHPYKDHCKSWEKSDKEPLIFYKPDSPVNVDIYGNTKNQLLGFDVSEFGKETGSLVTEEGYGYELNLMLHDE